MFISVCVRVHIYEYMQLQLSFGVLPCVKVRIECCTVLQRVAVWIRCCNVLQGVAVQVGCCSMLQRVEVWIGCSDSHGTDTLLQCFALFQGADRVAVCCSVSQFG